MVVLWLVFSVVWNLCLGIIGMKLLLVSGVVWVFLLLLGGFSSSMVFSSSVVVVFRVLLF